VPTPTEERAQREEGAATIYHPTDTTLPSLGGVAISPGYTETQSAISWFGPRLASHGFVVITFNTNSAFDQPASSRSAASRRDPTP
jgi:hypothetical protein